MNQSPQARATFVALTIFAALCTALCTAQPVAKAAGGVLTLATRDDVTQQPVPARLELRNDAGRKPAVRRATATGPGVVLNRSLDLAVPEGQYRFRLVRGPEYRIVSGDFTMQRSAADERLVTLSRMVDMKSHGYFSGDMAVPDPGGNLPLRMAAEDLHVGAVLDRQKEKDLSSVAQKFAAEEPQLGPIWLGQSIARSEDVLFYSASGSLPSDGVASASLAALEPDSLVRVAVANPFAWQLPVWLASERINGIFVLGDWLREGTRVERIANGRPATDIGYRGLQGPGRYAESIYWQLLEAGFEVAPLAGTGPASSGSAVGYNRVYAIGPSRDPDDERQVAAITSEELWYDAVWAGRSMITNGPLLRPTLGGQAPGHRFEAHQGEVLEMSVELHLAVRDPVDYLEVIHNGEVFYSARLDEFAEAGGMIPPLKIDRSGWVMVRVVTGYEEHFRAAMSAPWYIHFDQTPRVSRKAVEYFGNWLADCETELKKLPAARLAPHIEPVKTARAFWNRRLQAANAD
jgi:hypothetical protein